MSELVKANFRLKQVFLSQFCASKILNILVQIFTCIFPFALRTVTENWIPFFSNLGGLAVKRICNMSVQNLHKFTLLAGGTKLRSIVSIYFWLDLPPKYSIYTFIYDSWSFLREMSKVLCPPNFNPTFRWVSFQNRQTSAIQDIIPKYPTDAKYWKEAAASLWSQLIISMGNS